MASICSLGDALGLPVTAQEVREHLASLDDEESQRWLIKARVAFEAGRNGRCHGLGSALPGS